MSWFILGFSLGVFFGVALMAAMEDEARIVGDEAMKGKE